MPLFNQLRLEDPEKWKAHYSFGGALLLSFSLEAPGQLSIALNASKGTAHPTLSGLNDIARMALPKNAFLAQVRVSCSGVRGVSWVGRPKVLSDLRETSGSYGAIELLEVKRVTIAEKALWPDAPASFRPTEAPVELFEGRMTGADFAVRWFSESASLREGA